MNYGYLGAVLATPPVSSKLPTKVNILGVHKPAVAVGPSSFEYGTTHDVNRSNRPIDVNWMRRRSGRLQPKVPTDASTLEIQREKGAGKGNRGRRKTVDRRLRAPIGEGELWYNQADRWLCYERLGQSRERTWWAHCVRV